MKRISLFSLTVLFFALMGYSTPTWMWIGTYSIDNGPCNLGYLGNCSTNGNYFYNGAVTYKPTSGPTPTHYLNILDDSVYLNKCQASSRELCDFVVMSGHGWKRHMAINSNSHTCPYYDMSTAEMAFGKNYTRWVFLTGCNTLYYDNFNDFFYGSASWDTAFEGIQCVLGYGSSGYIFPNQCTKFWELWTSGYSIWSAYDQATEYAIYEQGGLGIRPACVTSRDTTGHYFWNDSYSAATSTKAVTWPTGTCWAIYGTPVY